MREVKFRAWLTEETTNFINFEAKMEYDVTVSEGKYALMEGSEIYGTFEKVPLMQDTGLKDKNGVEIYEGDIVKGDWDIVEDIYVSDVQFYGGAFRVRRTGRPLEYAYMFKQCEVIGNIYENPELLD